MVKRYAKGYRSERELIYRLSELGFMVVRTPRSGRISLASPDVIAIRSGKIIVIECKSRASAFSVPQDQIDGLYEWEEKAGASAYVGWKISRFGWRFLKLGDVVANNGNVGKRLIEEKGINIENL